MIEECISVFHEFFVKAIVICFFVENRFDR
jgi:hypothetical protein